MPRRVLIISLLLSIGASAWAVASFHVANIACVSIGDHFLGIASASGCVHLEWVEKWPEIQRLQFYVFNLDRDGDWQEDVAEWAVVTPDTTRHFLGFGFGISRFDYDGGIGEEADDRGWTATGTRIWIAIIPIWFLILVTLSPILLFLWRRRFSASKAGLCAKCGYDLRASRLRCPECGTPVTDARKPEKDSFVER